MQNALSGGTANLYGVDPLLAGVSFGDLRLRIDSPAVDAGTEVDTGGMPLPLPGEDLEGDQRVLGQIDIGADEFASAVPVYPGTGEDLVLHSLVNGAGNPALNQKVVFVGDTVDLSFFSPLGTYSSSPYVFVAGAFPTASPPTAIPTLPGIWIPPAFSILIDGFTPIPPGVVPQLGPAGQGLQLTVPVTLTGTSVMFQAFVIDPMTATGFYAASDGHEIQLP